METFCESYGLKNLIKLPTCHNDLPNPSCIDLTLTNSSLSFQSLGVVETGLSDFHKMIVTVIKTTFQKLDPKIIHYRDYRKYNNYSCRQDLLFTLIMENINSSNGLQKFIDMLWNHWINLLHGKKYSRGNNMPFINKLISHAHMERTRPRNCYLKNRS